MVSLPPEVLRLIFPLLVQKDKLECMTVCQQWQKVIHEHSLFRDIFIQRQEQLDQLIESVKRQPSLGTKVERLVLQLRLNKNYDAETLIDLFPNLRDFSLLNLNNDNYGDKAYCIRQNHPWCESLETIVEISSDLNAKSLLLSGMCNHLTYIAVNGAYIERPISIIKALSNAPALKKLHLKQYDITFQDLELLHQTVPHLHSLLLKSVTIKCQHIPRDIKPATSLKSLRFELLGFYINSYNLNPLLPYMSQKYKHLEDLKFSLDRFPLDWDKEDDDNIDTEEQQGDIIESFMTTLGSQLKTLSLTVSDVECDEFSIGFDIFHLDNFGCELKNLTLGDGIGRTIIRELSHTSQTEHIQSLTVDRMYGDTGRSVFLRWIRKFVALKELTLHCPVNYPPINGYFSDDMMSTGDEEEEEEDEEVYDRNIPAKKYILCLTTLLSFLYEKPLETLRLYSPHLMYDDSMDTPVYPSLKNLTLSGVTFQAGTDAFISRTFPNLRRLTLENCLFKGDSFSLPSTDLSYLEIVSTGVKEDFTVMVTTLGNGQQRLYSSTRQSSFFKSFRTDIEEDIFTLPPISSRPFDKSKDIPTVKIVCNSLYDFYMKSSETN